MTHSYDAIVIGAGPAGSTASAALALHGRKVLALEREKFPRYHIGESLLPFTFQPLKRIGLIDKMRQSAFVKKYSVQFVVPSGKASQPFYFYTRYDRDTIAQTWQVLRSEFDVMLLNNNVVSVGVVAEGKYLARGGVKDPGKIFQREINQNLWIKEYLSCGAQFGPYYITGEFSFHSRHCGVEGLLLVGDAYCFLDPVFSSGVMLALKSGVMAGDAVHEALVADDFSPARFEAYATKLREGIENMRKLVYAFYNPNFSFRELTDKYPEVAGEITDCLSGDVNKDFTVLWKKIGEFVPLPGDLPVGGPLVGAPPGAKLS